MKAIKLQLSGEQVEMVAADVVEHEAILSQAESDAPGMVKKAIETFLSRNDISDSQIVVAVPGQQTLTRFTKMPPVEAKKIPDMVQYEASQQIPFDMDEVVWDYQVFTADDSPDVEVGVFAIRKELIRSHLMHFTEEGIEPIIVQTSPMASYNAAQYEWPAEDGKAAILLDMGALATDLIVFEGRRIWSRPVPIGGNRFTEALVSAFKISFRKAEKLKRTAATSKYARQVFQAMRPVFADLVSEIQRSIGFYTSTHREAAITRVIGMGNAFKLPGLQKFLNQNLQIEVKKTSSFKKINVASGVKSEAYTDNVLSFGVAYGLALQGLGLASVESNLLPVEVRRTLLWRKKRSWFGASAASLALAAGSLWVGNVMTTNQLRGAMGDRPDPSHPKELKVSGADGKLVRDTGKAAQVVRRPPTAEQVAWAAEVCDAAKTLESEYQDVARQTPGDVPLLNLMAELPGNSVLVPRIVDVIRRAFAANIGEEVTSIKTAREYVAAARHCGRVERAEVWIKLLQMQYDPKNAASGFPRETGVKKKIAKKAGWAVAVVGRTTESDKAKVTRFIDPELVDLLERLGREPGRGFHIAKVKFVKTALNSDSDRDMVTPFKRQGAKSSGSRGGLRGGTRGGIRGGIRGGTRGGTRGDTRGGTRGRTRGAVPGGFGLPGQGASKGPGAGLLGWEERFRKEDPLTGEDMTGDQQFLLQIVIHKGDTPENLIPDEYKPKKDEDKATGSSGKDT